MFPWIVTLPLKLPAEISAFVIPEIAYGTLVPFGTLFVVRVNVRTNPSSTSPDGVAEAE